MNRIIPCLIILLLAGAFPAYAGDDKEVEGKQVQRQEEAWTFNLGIPIWLAGIDGRTGVLGRTVGVDVDAATILGHANFLASYCAEVHKGPFGFYTDFLYLDDRAGMSTQGLVSDISLRVNEYLVNAEVNWRVIDRPWGWLEVRAGCRYTNLYERLGLNPNGGAIEDASQQLVDATATAIRDLLTQDLRGVLDGNSPVLPIAPLAADQKETLVTLIQQARQDPVLAAALRSGIQSRIDAAKRDLQQRIAGILTRNLSRTFTLAQQWFDPYIGLAGRYNITPAFYLTAKGDIGGFGVGSRLTWQAYGALGCQITQKIYSEAGYRYLSVDYRNGGFLYDVATRGAQVTVGIIF